MTYSIIVPDSSPLITLAAADSLDVLLKPGVPVIVPDGVHWETTRNTHLLGATENARWISSNRGKVLIDPTEEFVAYQQRAAQGFARSRNLGERCAVEVVDREAKRNPGHRSILVFEDSDVILLKFTNPDLVDTLTTADFLDELQRARLIQSSNHILDSAVEAGRQIGIRSRRLDQAMGAFASQGQGWS